ncbi:nucleotidyltransferase domain-containing protein [Vallitalea pronyensis]|uniref:Nucleotidyltransferase domain-containing protein n=1 Tax=Vallitalea pronyensis TaxID=1348613 RepID=A0A8J8SHQ2_9FIRM|nr:nucleotidyltransferase domain-containing protein [Vallitalea pronyensis]QUI23669.1 nucleotidyltransferase domain-containing protein [Vallitalea pronyensis]
MNEISKELLEEAKYYCHELSKHDVLKRYWHALSLILKGSTARGTADAYSDIDLVFFCSKDVKEKIIKAYYEAELIDRQDGVFLPLPDWIGHYHMESYGKLRSYFEEKNYEEVWEYTHVKVLHDAHGQFASIVNEHTREPIVTLEDIKRQYINLQLDLDWMRHPLKRGDEMSVYVFGGRLLKKICQAYYLLDEEAYPNDKWLFYHLQDTSLGKKQKDSVLSFSKTILDKDKTIPCGLELTEYHQYTSAEALIQDIAQCIKEKYGNHPWLDEWYLYV